MVELTNIFTLKNIIIYLLIINIIAFFAMFIDKKKAEKDRWRIKESTLLTLALIGGSIGAIAGMYTFQHKRKPYNNRITNVSWNNSRTNNRLRNITIQKQ